MFLVKKEQILLAVHHTFSKFWRFLLLNELVALTEESIYTALKDTDIADYKTKNRNKPLVHFSHQMSSTAFCQSLS